MDNVDQDTSDALEFDCFPTAWELQSTIATEAGRIATTWTTQPYYTLSYTDDSTTFTSVIDSTGGAVVSQTSGPVITTSAGKTASATATQGSSTTSGAKVTTTTSTTSSPTASKSASKAATGTKLSCGSVFLVALSVLALAC